MHRPEYPRPNFARDEWMCLNGTWDFVIEDETRTIEVPFVFQSKLSGINDNRMCDNVTYSREFTVPDSWQGRRIMLHFGAVDYECRVYVNDAFVGGHTGGSAAFSFDITPQLVAGNQKLRVEVYDPCTDQHIPRGKQFWREKPAGIWYTRTTGIWQSVWLEPVCATHIKSLRFTPDVDRGMVVVEYELDGDTNHCDFGLKISMDDTLVHVSKIGVVDNSGKVAIDVISGDIDRHPVHGGGWYWSPENPRLFQVEATLQGGGEIFDKTQSYFGMRKIEARDGRVFLNNRPYIHKLVLDQGYWPESLMTAPTDEAFQTDIRLAKEMGFNGCRKHQKSEDPRFLYWADRLGFLVYAEVPATVLFSQKSANAFLAEWMEITSRDYNHPSIVGWVAINESWGVPDIGQDVRQQQYSLALYHYLRAIDNTRLVVSNDGWEMTRSDICAVHSYDHGGEDQHEKKAKFARDFATRENILAQTPGGRRLYAGDYAYDGAPIMVSECGGISLKSEESKGWGYTQAAHETEFLATYERIMQTIFSSGAVCGFCYTQLTDVEQEVNGLLTAERVTKVDVGALRALHDGVR